MGIIVLFYYIMLSFGSIFLVAFPIQLLKKMNIKGSVWIATIICVAVLTPSPPIFLQSVPVPFATVLFFQGFVCDQFSVHGCEVEFVDLIWYSISFPLTSIIGYHIIKRYLQAHEL
jgi:hypothetical protein